jgi:GH24 family phage-related lysozyme (muramidase)
VAGYLEETISKLKEFEGCVPWMYRDTAGKVTVGVGLMLPNAATASALPFLIAGVPASPEQIAEEFARVNALAQGKLPAFYKLPTSPELPQPVIDAKLTSVLTEFEATLRAKLTGYDALPDGVKMALLDMAYNLGPAGLLTGYPHMLNAVKTGSWSQAAAECSRQGISAARNSWTQAQFLSTVVDSIRAEARAEVKAEVKAIEEAPVGWFTKLRKLLFGK